MFSVAISVTNVSISHDMLQIDAFDPLPKKKKRKKFYPSSLTSIRWTQLKNFDENSEGIDFFLYSVMVSYSPPDVKFGLLSFADLRLNKGDCSSADLPFYNSPENTEHMLRVRYIRKVTIYTVLELRQLQSAFGILFSSAISSEHFPVLTWYHCYFSTLLVI